jgi:hypothetical protein
VFAALLIGLPLVAAVTDNFLLKLFDTFSIA